MQEANEQIAGKVVLLTGGTGSFGQEFARTCLQQHKPKKLIIFSRDELKQFEMRRAFPESSYPNLRFFIGDIRDRERLYRALDGVDLVVHAAALKQVPACEYNPIEAIRTNILGATHLVDAAIDRRVKKVIALSTDKAANPINLYGATKLCSDKLFVAGNNYSGSYETKFSVVRYGNVIGSRGSVVPFFQNAAKTGKIPVTDPRMTRFIITLDQGVDLVLKSFQRMRGGEIFVPKIPSINILDIAKAIAPKCKIEIVGIRPGEKLHEIMVTVDDSRNTVDMGDHYVILSNQIDLSIHLEKCGGTLCKDGFAYSSDTNDEWLNSEEFNSLLNHKRSENLKYGSGKGLFTRAVATPHI